MKLARLLLAVAVIGASASVWAQEITQRGPGIVAIAGVKTTFVTLGSGQSAMLYEPVNPGTKAQIAIFSMHSALDFLTHSSCSELSTRGYRVLCANNANSKSRWANEGMMFDVLLTAKAAMSFLRSYPGVNKIVLWGHSGGASVMTAYQDVAENGVKACQEAVKIYKCPDTLAGLPPADGVILGDANWGIANDVLTATDPALTSIDNGMTLNPDLDMFNAKNGFKTSGTTYSQDFIKRFLAAQAKRNNAVVDLALQRLAIIEAGKGMYSDDEPFTISGAIFTANKLYTADMRLLAHTQKAWPLLHVDGSVTTQIVPSVRVPTATQTPSHSMKNGALKTTVRGFLSTYAVRATDKYGYGEDTGDMGVVWRSSIGSNPGNVEGVRVPFLTMAMTGSFEMGSAETIHNHVKAADKSIIYVEGATHNYNVCKRCEKTPGQYGDTTKLTYDYADQWLSKPGRFL
jgi:hypothetical protein